MIPVSGVPLIRSAAPRRKAKLHFSADRNQLIYCDHPILFGDEGQDRFMRMPITFQWWRLNQPNVAEIEMTDSDCAGFAMTQDKKRFFHFGQKSFWHDFETNLSIKLPIGDLDRSRIKYPMISPSGNFITMSHEEVSPNVVPKWISYFCHQVKTVIGYDVERHWYSVGKPYIDLWDVQKAKRDVQIIGHYCVGFSSDNQIFATQDENYNIFFWDIPPRRNWSLAASLAIVPATIVTAVLLAVVSLGRRIYRRFRPTAANSH